MKLAPPPTRTAAWAGRPPLHETVGIQNPDNLPEEWTVTLRLRTVGYDVASRPAGCSFGDGQTMLIWRSRGTVWRYPVRLEPVAGPLPGWRVRYLIAPQSMNVRREWRNDRDTLFGRVRRPDDEATQAVETRSHDFSPSAMRFWVPWPMVMGETVFGQWLLEDGVLEAFMRVVRCPSEPVWYRSQQGFQVVAAWESLSPTAQYRWRAYCWRHQPGPGGGMK